MSVSEPHQAVAAGLTLTDLVGRDVAILGAGREGLAVWRRLREHAPQQALTLYAEQDPGPGVRAGLGPRDRLVVAPLDGARLAGHDLLVRSPGISPYREPLVRAREAGVAFTSGTNLWLAAHPRARTLCITGTKGKSTTSALLHHLLRAAGARAALAGNIGVPLIDCDPGAADWWVVELSSYQICDLRERPWLAVLLNLYDEHLDWHGGAAAYRRDKLRLAALAPPGRLLANGASAALRDALAGHSDVSWYNVPGALERRDEALWDGANRLPDLPGAPGAHNLDNLAAALAVVDRLDLRPAPLAPALATFEGLPHRQRTIGERDGLTFVDDSLSTTPVATLAALRALAGRPVTVLVGGLDRGIDWRPHAADLAAAGPHALIGLPDSGASILGALAAEGLAPPGGQFPAADMASAVARAREMTPAGGVVLLSPGAPSFPHYRDYQARGEAFARAAGIR